ncbi:MAG: cyclic nucleotide-binding domain-containing protein [Chthonomonadales bacterium]|nr:cyclic nucleotide-binding domain-containing protein [Chthonomonadales bacterium]
MNTMERTLSEHPFFQDLDDEALKTVAGCASNVRMDPGKILFREGEEADRFYLIREGSVVLEVFNLELGSLPLQTLEAGQVVGWSWLVPPYRWRFDARCVTDVRAFALDGLCLRAKCEADPHLGYELLKRFAMLIDQRLQATRRQLVEAQSRAI